MRKSVRGAKTALLLLLLAGSLAACTSGTGPKETGGTLLGAGLGALAGSQLGSGSGQLAAVGAGTMLGAFLGNEIGRSLDRADRNAMAQTTQNALEFQPSGSSLAWSNPDTGNSGFVTPEPAFQNQFGEYCREYYQTITIGGEIQEGYGTACRQGDGTWRIVSG